MSNDRFKFRVWDKWEKTYAKDKFFISMDGTLEQILSDGDLILADSNLFIIEQCTGLKDCKDRLIFEGDIVKPTDPEEKGRYVVEWDHSTYGFSFQKVNGFKSQKFYYLYSDDVEIVGNIHKEK